LVDCSISAKAFSESKPSRDEGEQKFEGRSCKDVCANHKE